MSSKNNVNPDHYKLAGRDRPNENVLHEQEKRSLAQEQERRERRKKVQPRPADARQGARTGGGEE
jgi:hypothetical protein